MDAESLKVIKDELGKHADALITRMKVSEEKAQKAVEAVEKMRTDGDTGAAKFDFLGRMARGMPRVMNADEGVDEFTERLVVENNERAIVGAVSRGQGLKVRGRIRSEGLPAVRVLRAVALAKRRGGFSVTPSHDQVIEILRGWGDNALAGLVEAQRDAKGGAKNERSTSLNSTILGEGAGFVTPQMWGGFIDFLYPATVVRELGAMSVPVSQGNSIEMLYGDTAAGAAYRGQRDRATQTTAREARMVLNLKLLSAFLVLTNELLEESSLDMDVYARDLLARAVSQAENLAFLRSIGSQNEPKGLDFWIDSALNPMTTSDHKRTRTLDGVTSLPTFKTARKDLLEVMRVVEEENIPDLRRPGWAMNVATAYGLMRCLDVNDRAQFGEEMRGGTLFGAPFRKTTAIVKNEAGDGGGSGTGNKSVLYFGDWSTFVIAERPGVDTKVQDGAAYRDVDGNIVPGIQTNEVVFVVHAKHETGCLFRGREFCRLESVDWSAAF